MTGYKGHAKGKRKTTFSQLRSSESEETYDLCESVLYELYCEVTRYNKITEDSKNNIQRHEDRCCETPWLSLVWPVSADKFKAEFLPPSDCGANTGLVLPRAL